MGGGQGGDLSVGGVGGVGVGLAGSPACVGGCGVGGGMGECVC